MRAPSCPEVPSPSCSTAGQWGRAPPKPPGPLGTLVPTCARCPLCCLLVNKCINNSSLLPTLLRVHRPLRPKVSILVAFEWPSGAIPLPAQVPLTGTRLRVWSALRDRGPWVERKTEWGKQRGQAWSCSALPHPRGELAICNCFLIG